jgi:hypothetical protein
MNKELQQMKKRVWFGSRSISIRIVARKTEAKQKDCKDKGS